MANSNVKLRAPRQFTSPRVRVPGSKSFTNRALISAACGTGKATLRGYSKSDDTEVLISALEVLGVGFEEQATELSVTGSAGKFSPYIGDINVGAAGTSMRFLTALCSFVEGCAVVLKGSERMHERPIDDLVEPLRFLGADIEYLGTRGCPPILIRGVGTTSSCLVEVKGDISSQFLSALLLSAPLCESGLRVVLNGDLVSRKYVDMTCQVMRDFGVWVDRVGYQQFEVSPASGYTGCTYEIESDATGAGYFFAMAAISGAKVIVDGLCSNTLQGDIELLSILERMGCQIEQGVQGQLSWISVTGPDKLKCVNADMSLLPDSAQTLAVVASVADGTSYITGLSTLRHKETDRIKALMNELNKIGIKSEEYQDGIAVHGGNPTAATIATYQDHRMAMSFACLACKVKDLIIEQPTVVSKSFPQFWNYLADMGFEIEYV